MKKRIEFIDYLKGYSIFTIVLMHLIQGYTFVPGFINTAASLGGAGVHAFIICSGFGLSLSYDTKPVSFRTFVKKRFSKIYAPYIGIVLISAFFPFMYQGSDRVQAFFSHVFLFKMFVPKYEGSFGGQLWFMSTIIQFYFTFYLFIKVKDKLRQRYLPVMILCSAIWSIFVVCIQKEDVRVWNSFFLQYAWEFALGMVLAQRYLKNGIKVERFRRGYMLAGAVLLLAISGLMGIGDNGILKMFNDIPSSLGYILLAGFIYSLGIGAIRKFFVWVSQWSFEWYLVHILIFELVYQLFGSRIPESILAAAMFLLSILAAKIYALMWKHIFYIQKGGYHVGEGHCK